MDACTRAAVGEWRTADLGTWLCTVVRSVAGGRNAKVKIDRRGNAPIHLWATSFLREDRQLYGSDNANLVQLAACLGHELTLLSVPPAAMEDAIDATANNKSVSKPRGHVGTFRACKLLVV